MGNILFVKANPKADDQSESTKLANYFLDLYKNKHPDDTVEKLYLYESDIPFLDVDVFAAWGKFASQEQLTDKEMEKAERMDKLTDQFLAADKVVFAAPFWNLSFPPMLKAYIDTICISGKTFQYTDTGPVGLVSDKPVLLVETRGGIYSEGPAAHMENSLRYLKTIMQFIGIETFHSVIAEGLDINEELQVQAIDEARRELEAYVSTF